MAEFLREKIIITRKAHRCHGCTHTYPAKSKMTQSVNVSDGEIYTLYFCENCIEYIKDHPDYFKYGEEIYPGDMLNDKEYVQKYIKDAS
jgi:hypothetical protein